MQSPGPDADASYARRHRPSPREATCTAPWIPCHPPTGRRRDRHPHSLPVRPIAGSADCPRIGGACRGAAASACHPAPAKGSTVRCARPGGRDRSAQRHPPGYRIPGCDAGRHAAALAPRNPSGIPDRSHGTSVRPRRDSLPAPAAPLRRPTPRGSAARPVWRHGNHPPPTPKEPSPAAAAPPPPVRGAAPQPPRPAAVMRPDGIRPDTYVRWPARIPAAARTPSATAPRCGRRYARCRPPPPRTHAHGRTMPPAR